MKNRKLVYLGYIIPFLFWLTIVICGFMTDNYNHMVNLVSELGAKGTKTQYIFTAGFVLMAGLSVFFIIELNRIARDIGLNKIPILLLFAFSFSIFGAAVFPLPSSLHGLLGSPSMLIPLSPLLTLILWKDNKVKNIKIASTIVLLFMLLGFLIMIPEIMGNYFGLKQRFFHVAWSLWFIYLSKSFSGINI